MTRLGVCDLITRIALRLTVFRWTNAQRDLEERRRESLLFLPVRGPVADFV